MEKNYNFNWKLSFKNILPVEDYFSLVQKVKLEFYKDLPIDSKKNWWQMRELKGKSVQNYTVRFFYCLCVKEVLYK